MDVVCEWGWGVQLRRQPSCWAEKKKIEMAARWQVMWSQKVTPLKSKRRPIYILIPKPPSSRHARKVRVDMPPGLLRPAVLGRLPSHEPNLKTKRHPRFAHAVIFLNTAGTQPLSNQGAHAIKIKVLPLQVSQEITGYRMDIYVFLVFSGFLVVVVQVLNVRGSTKGRMVIALVDSFLFVVRVFDTRCGVWNSQGH